jgi:hypothetical protein
MPARTFYTSQILANCAVLFPGKSPHMITVNDGGKRRIFIVSSITGELLLEHAGTNPPDILRLLTHTENLLSSHVPAIRQGKGPVIGDSKVDWKGLLKEVENLRQEAAQMKEKSAAEVADLKKEIESLKAQAAREVMGWKRENDTLRGEVEYHRESAKMNMGRPGQAGWGGTPTTSVFGD